MHKNYIELTHEEHQQIVIKIAKEIHNICERNNIKYYLYAGALLGAVRNNSIISWDEDIDLCMFREDYERFLKAAEKELPSYLFMQTQFTDPYYDVLGVPCKIRLNNSLWYKKQGEDLMTPQMHNGIFIDIFPLDHVPEDKMLYDYQGAVAIKTMFSALSPEFQEEMYKTLRKWNGNSSVRTPGIDTYWNCNYFFDEKIFEDRILYELNGEYFYGVRDYNAMLSVMYGDDYMTPKMYDDPSWHSCILKSVKEKMLGREVILC